MVSRRTFLQATGAGAVATKLLGAIDEVNAAQPRGQAQTAQKPNLLLSARVVPSLRGDVDSSLLF